MTPREIAEIRPRLLDFAAEMLGGLRRKDQRAKGEFYGSGLLTDGRRKSMQPVAARLGRDHQWLQQFITSSSGSARWTAAQKAGAWRGLGDVGEFVDDHVTMAGGNASAIW